MKLSTQSIRETIHTLWKSLLYLASGITLAFLFSTSTYAETSKTPYLLFSDQSTAAQFPLLSTELEADLKNNTLYAEVTQVYENQNPEAQDAVFVFPEAEKATIQWMRVTIGEKVSMMDLASHNLNAFQTTLEAIPPGSSIEISVCYKDSLHVSTQTEQAKIY